MRGTFDHPSIQAVPQHIAACEVQPGEEKKKNKSRRGVYFAKNNQTKTIWRAGMLPFIASENMFKVISMKDLHNCKRNYSRGRKKRKHQTICSCARSNSRYALVFSMQHDLLTDHSRFPASFQLPNIKPVPARYIRTMQLLPAPYCCPSSFQSVYITR